MKNYQPLSPSLQAQIRGPVSLAFDGQCLKVSQDQFTRWQAAFRNIPDLRAALQTADDRFAETPSRDGQYVGRASRWLEIADHDWQARRKQELRDRGEAW